MNLLKRSTDINAAHIWKPYPVV